MRNKGKLIVFSGPSGSGKDTVLNELLKSGSNKDKFVLSVSATTREPRVGEQNGVNYYFYSKTEFKELIENDGFIEYAQYCDNYYGTPKAPVEKALNDGKDVILEIEVQGALQVMEKYSDCVSIFLMPPSIKELEKRLTGRNTDDEDVIKKRIDKSVTEIGLASNYDYIVVNDEILNAVEAIEDIVKACSYSSKFNKNIIDEVLKNG